MKKRIVVTGGNRGIGLEIVSQLARHGHEVILAARDGQAGQQAASKLKKEGIQVEFRKIDLEFPKVLRILPNLFTKTLIALMFSSIMRVFF
ncbi:MAG: SDR family NAD(P)-dependent oxidoreductase [Fulvivirga sp.]|nr:SDR family NAD(P)-dependent oxidoreductase [Fulvivirga sp.]